MKPVPQPRSAPLPAGPVPASPAVAAQAARLAYATQVAFGFLLAGLGPCLVLLARDLATPRERLSWMAGGFGAGLLLLGAAGERLLRLGVRRSMAVSAAGQAAGGVLLALSTSLQPVRAGALLLGLGGAGMVLCTPLLFSGPGATARMSRAFGLSSLSGILAPLAISAVEATTGHGRAGLLLAVPLLLWAALRFPPTPPAAAAVAPASASGGAARPPSPAARGAGLRAALGWAGVVASVSPEFAFVVWGAARLQDSGLSPAAASAAASAFPIGMAVGRLVALPRLLGRGPLALWGSAVAAAAAVACAAPLGPVAITAATALAGLGIAPLYPLSIDRLVRTPGLDPRRGSAVGALGSGTAILLAPILLARLAQATSLRLGFLAAVPLLGLVVLLQRAGGGRPAHAAGESPPRSSAP